MAIREDKMTEFKKEIEGIMEKLDCPKDFACYKVNFENLCEAENMVGGFTECNCDSYSHFPEICPFGFDFGYSYFCSCPLRVFVAKEQVYNSYGQYGRKKG